MKKTALIFLLLCWCTMGAQITQVSGNQNGTWSGEIHIIDEVFVPGGETLTIDAGTKIIADGYFGITVTGNLFALGEEDARITFTVADTTGYSNYEDPTSGGWDGFNFRKPGQVLMRYCDFSYGKTEDSTDGGMMWISYATDFEIANSTFHHNTTRRKGGAIYAENSSLNIHDCEIYECLAEAPIGSWTWGVGCQFLKCNLDLHDMVFHDNISSTAYGGGMNIDSCDMTLKNAVFYNNFVVNAGGLGIQRCKGHTVKVSDILAYNNVVIHYGGGLAMAESDPELNNLTIVNNYCGAGGGGMQMAFNACPTINNSIFWGNHAIMEITETDTVEYYDGCQIWLWGDNNYPTFNNGLVMYGIDTIFGGFHIDENHYNDMLETNPLFVDEKHHDYRLMPESPCINAGTADISGLFIPETDLAGGPRVYNDRIDMGCYEWNNLNVNEFYGDGNQISVYPNPLNGNGLCVINLKSETNIVVKLISLDGKELYRKDYGVFEAGEHRIPLNGVLEKLEKKNDLYLLIIDTESDRCINKIIY